MRLAFGPGGLPVNTYAGDGTPLTQDEVRTIDLAYDSVAMPVLLRPGDVLLLDNVLTAHGRRPYTGDRRLMVAMGHPLRAGRG